MSILITGAAGFIGSNLVENFLNEGKKVIGIDNFSRGEAKNISKFQSNPLFIFHEMDMNDYKNYHSIIKAESELEFIDEVWHMAANSDIPAGIKDASVDLKDTFMTTFYTLQIMQDFDIKFLSFASSSAIYGDLGEIKLVEDVGPLFPISNYGAMKLASEASISAAVESYLDAAYIFRFPNVVGVPATHGVILDFMNKLKDSPQNLKVLGDGTQQKSYLHINDLINAMIKIRNGSQKGINYYNIGAYDDDGIPVRDIANFVVERVSPKANINFGKGNKGWVGDVPKFKYSVDKLVSIGWQPNLNSIDAIKLAIDEIAHQENIK